MTAVKQKAVTAPRHAENVGHYLDDERALARESQHIVDEDRWAQEMEATRAAYGHDKPARAGHASACMFHQVLAFNPDECSVNGGVMAPKRCMAYAREWVERRYPNQEAVWVLHQEHCKRDGTDRFAVHIAINRTDLETGRRLDEGRSKNAKIERANAIRDMDREWGLRELRANERNSHVHARQPTRAELEMEARGVRSDKQYIREAIAASMREVAAAPQDNRVRQLAESLRDKGVRMSASEKSDDFKFERESTGFSILGYALGRGYSKPGIVQGLGYAAGLEVKLKKKQFSVLNDMAHAAVNDC